MPRWFRYVLVAPVLLFACVLAVQGLRAIALGEEERQALAVMQPLPAPPAGESGYKYLAFTHSEVPAEELDAALAAELQAFEDWHAGSGARGLAPAGAAAAFASPAAVSYPTRPSHARPEQACDFGELNCLDKLQGHEIVVRDWLERDAARLALAERALRSETLANPFPLADDMPLTGFQVLHLPINDIAMQSLDGDTAGALARACDLLASGRRFLRHGGALVDRMVHAAVVDGASALVLSLRRAGPALPMPANCGAALAPVDAGDYLICGSLRSEQALAADQFRRHEQALARSFNPGHWLKRWLLWDADLMLGWRAEDFAPFCSDAGLAQIAKGLTPAAPVRELDRTSVDFWAAPSSHVLSSANGPDYGRFQKRMLDYAAKLRLHLAAIAVGEGQLAVADLPAAVSSPGRGVQHQDGDWVLALSEGRKGQPPERRIAIRQ